MIETLLKAEGRDWLLADGAIGTNLIAMGLPSGEPPEAWNATHPDRIRALHRGFVEAGADLLLTNSFGGNARRLGLHGLDKRVVELNRIAAELAREVAGAAGRRMLVAGSVGPTGELFEPFGALTEDAAVGVFAEQIEGLKAGGADLVWIETMSAVEEMRAAATAAASAAMPCAITASFSTAGATMMGITPPAMAAAVRDFGAPLHGLGCNCGVGPADLVMSLLAMRAASGEVPLIAKANCGAPRICGAEVVYDGTPELMARYACLAVDAGAGLVGGCCGTSFAHLRAMRRALDAHRRRRPPTPGDVVAALGPLVFPALTGAAGGTPM